MAASSNTVLSVSLANTNAREADLPFSDKMRRQCVERNYAVLRVGRERNSYKLLIRVKAHLRQVLCRLVHLYATVDPQVIGREQDSPRQRVTAETPATHLTSSDADFLRYRGI